MMKKKKVTGVAITVLNWAKYSTIVFQTKILMQRMLLMTEIEILFIELFKKQFYLKKITIYREIISNQTLIKQ